VSIPPRLTLVYLTFLIYRSLLITDTFVSVAVPSSPSFHPLLLHFPLKKQFNLLPSPSSRKRRGLISETEAGGDSGQSDGND